MKKTIAVVVGLLLGSQALAEPWHGSRHNYRNGYHGGAGYNNYHNHSRYNDNYYNYYKNNKHSRGQWRHTHHNGQLAWWFVVGSMFYLSEQAYLNDRRNYETVIVNTPRIYNPPRYVEQRVYSEPSYRSYGWYCEATGRFSAGSYDTCPTPWVSRQY